jgi:hypothetical protein
MSLLFRAAESEIIFHPERKKLAGARELEILSSLEWGRKIQNIIMLRAATNRMRLYSLTCHSIFGTKDANLNFDRAKGKTLQLILNLRKIIKLFRPDGSSFSYF